MRILIYILYLGFMFSGELEVEGDLNVTGNIDSPTIDALSGMKPERIYRYVGTPYETKGLAVPEGKMWLISSSIGSNLSDIYFTDTNAIVNIFEYPISGSGTDQGMDYVEP